ncbi:MAG: N-acetylmuramoyl-L-alanine amidase family protein [Lachnospirales bacterium]
MKRLTGLDLDYDFIPSNISNYGSVRSTTSIKYIVIHYTANKGDTDTGNGNYFSRTAVGAGAHYFVDEDSCTQSIQDNRVAYHCETKGMSFKCSCRNSNSIGVEMCSDFENGKYIITEKTKLNTVILTKWLMKKYGIKSSNVIRHYDVCGKICPEPWVRNENEWNSFKNMLDDIIKEDEEMVTETYIRVNGKDIKIGRILKEGKNYIDVRGLENAGFKVSYDANSKLVLLDNKINKLNIKANNENKEVNSVNINGTNFCSIRNLADVTNLFDVDYKEGNVLLTTK